MHHIRLRKLILSTDDIKLKYNYTMYEYCFDRTRFGCRIFDIQRKPISDRKSNLFAYLYWISPMRVSYNTGFRLVLLDRGWNLPPPLY